MSLSITKEFVGPSLKQRKIASYKERQRAWVISSSRISTILRRLLNFPRSDRREQRSPARLDRCEQ
jgi:hypothetical protein